VKISIHESGIFSIFPKKRLFVHSFSGNFEDVRFFVQILDTFEFQTGENIFLTK